MEKELARRALTLEQVLQRFAVNEAHERHENTAQTQFWCSQWRLLAKEMRTLLVPQAVATPVKRERVRWTR